MALGVVPAKAFCLDFISESTAYWEQALFTSYHLQNSQHLPFIIYHCNSSFNLVSADIWAHLKEFFGIMCGAEVQSQRETAFGFAWPVSPVKAIGIESTTQRRPSAQQQITIRQLFSRSIECFLFFVVSWPNWVLSSSPPLILSLHEAHTATILAPTRIS